MKAHVILFKLTTLLTLLCLPQIVHGALAPAAPAAASDTTASALVQAIRNKYCAVLEIEKEAPATIVTQGVNFAYTITVTNTSSAIANGVVVTDLLPAELTFVPGSSSTTQGTISSSGQTVTVTIGSIAPGASVTIVLTVTPNTPATVTNTATVTSLNAATDDAEFINIILVGPA